MAYREKGGTELHANKRGEFLENRLLSELELAADSNTVVSFKSYNGKTILVSTWRIGAPAKWNIVHKAGQTRDKGYVGIYLNKNLSTPFGHEDVCTDALMEETVASAS